MRLFKKGLSNLVSIKTYLIFFKSAKVCGNSQNEVTANSFDDFREIRIRKYTGTSHIMHKNIIIMKRMLFLIFNLILSFKISLFY